MCKVKKLKKVPPTYMLISGERRSGAGRCNRYSRKIIDYIRLIPGLETGSRALYMFVALARVPADVALHVRTGCNSFF